MRYRTDRLDEHVIELLQNGGVGFMPSDTIYGLSCRALDEQAVERIYALKKRDSEKPLIVLIATISQLDELGIKRDQASLAEQYWPGGLTLVCEAPGAPAYLHRGTQSLAVRLPDNNDLRDFMLKTGPLVSTSANTQGDAIASSIKDAETYFGEQLDFYVDAGDLSEHKPSTLVRAVNGKLEVVREGAVKVKEDL